MPRVRELLDAPKLATPIRDNPEVWKVKGAEEAIFAAQLLSTHFPAEKACLVEIAAHLFLPRPTFLAKDRRLIFHVRPHPTATMSRQLILGRPKLFIPPIGGRVIVSRVDEIQRRVIGFVTKSRAIEALGEQHQIGLILADDPSDYEAWVERVRARRWLPDPQDLNDFLGRIFPSTDHDEIIKLAK